MSLLETSEDLDAAGVPDCFYCTESLTFPAVHWLGATGPIALHPNCTLRLFMRLAVDLYVLDRSERLP